MKKITIFFAILVLTILIACKNHYNDMIKWTDSIKIGSDIQSVKNSQPDFLEISWDKPMKIGKNETLYEIVEIDGNYDILKMSNFLRFEGNKYQGREATK